MRLVAISDTHGSHEDVAVPDGDVLVVAGDFCGHGRMTDVRYFGDWLRRLPHDLKLVIAGNHDRPFEVENVYARSILGDGVVYLQDEEYAFGGLRFYGSPWQPAFNDWYFNLPRGPALAEKWAMIPEGIDVLVTHGPPFGTLDRGLGCEDLAVRVGVVQPRLHVFGHIHEGYGIKQHPNGRISANVAMLDGEYALCGRREPFVVDARAL